METKLEISGNGKTSPEVVNATYKPIPERDMEDEALSRPKSLVKVKASPEDIDGAAEKMLPNEEKTPEVMVFDNDAKSPQNGDAKLDIVEPKTAYVGLTKEELLKYANDPFWVRLRWFLFITFWLLWAAMLVGAVLIIYAAPKCNPPPPRTWYQQGPLTEIGELKDTTVDKNVQGIIVPWTGDAYEPLENRREELEVLKKLVKNGTKVILELEPSVSNYWFERSQLKDPEYDGYYIWKSGVVEGSDTSLSPPNKWISPTNKSSWKYSDVRQEYYYSPFSKPHLNFRNQSVVTEFNKVMERFLAYNISGFRLKNAGFLLVDVKFRNEDHNSLVTGTELTVSSYNFYKHSRTQDLPELAPLLHSWRTLIRNRTVDGTLMVAEELARVDSYKLNENLVVDLPLQSHIFSKPVLSVNETAASLNYTLHIDNIDWPLWEAKSTFLPKDVMDIITYLLPGVPLVNSSDVVPEELVELRQGPSIMRGICGVYGLKNNTILAFIRTTPGSPGLLVAVNPTDNTAVANIPAEIPPLNNLQEVTIRYYSSNYNETSFKDVGAKKDATAIPVTPKAAIVLEYVPKKDE